MGETNRLLLALAMGGHPRLETFVGFPNLNVIGTQWTFKVDILCTLLCLLLVCINSSSPSRCKMPERSFII